MASSTQIRTGLQTLIQDHLSDRLVNTLFNRMPLLYFLFAKEGDKEGHLGLGRPKTAMYLSGVDTSKAHKEEIIAARVYEPIIQTSLPAQADGKVVTMYDTMPVRASWTTLPPSGYFTRPRFKWVERIDPYKVPNKEIRITRSAAKNDDLGSKAIESLFTAETTSVLGQHMAWWNSDIWGTVGTGAPTNEDLIVWDSLHSLANHLAVGNVYGGVDRAIGGNAWWRGALTTGYTGGADFESMINYLNYDLSLSKKGTGIDLLLVDGGNFKKAKAEAKAKGGTILLNEGIQDYGKFGFKRELVKIDNTYIVFDPECPTGHVAALNTATWTFAIHPDANFRVTPPFDQSQIQGGDDAMAGVIRTEVMLLCEAPSLNAYFTGIA